MNYLKYPITLLLLIITLNSIAQSGRLIKLSDPRPKVGEQLRVNFRHETGSNLDGKVKAVIYFLDNDSSPAGDISLHKSGDGFSGGFVLPAKTKAFCIRFDYKNSDGKPITVSQVFPVYANTSTVDGAYANEAFASGLAAEMFGVQKDLEGAAKLYKREFGLHPKLEKDYEDMYLLTLLYTNPLNQNLAIIKAENFAKSGVEEQMIFALNYYQHAREKKRSDSLRKVILNLYPKGELNHTDLIADFNDQSEPAKKDSLYKLIAAYDDKNTYKAHWEKDDLKTKIAIAYLQAGDLSGYDKWVNQVQDKFYLPGAINDVVTSWLTSDKNLNLSKRAITNALTILRALLKNNLSEPYRSPLQVKSDNEDNYNACMDTYGQFLLKKGEFKEAITCEKIAYDSFRTPDTLVIAHYAAALNAGANPQLAQQIIERCLLAGLNSSALRVQAEISYNQIHGSKTGFDNYFSNISQASDNKDLSEKIKEIVNIPAPDFDLKDGAGHHITLSALKGKITVIDFWASWCAPCKASFPGMQLAINKYKQDRDVKFLFLDTWESGSDYIESAKKFMQANNYDFNVIFDEKAGDNRLSKVRIAYNVKGLPTKIIIDKNGNIRFIATGYGGSDQSVLSEVSSMIQILKKENN